MYIDDFIWSAAIVEKIESKHHIMQDEVEEVFSIIRNIVLLNQDIEKGRMYIRLVDKQKQADM